MLQTISNLISDQSGATAVEYGLIAALIGIVAMASLDAMGQSLTDMFFAVSTHIDTAVLAANGN